MMPPPDEIESISQRAISRSSRQDRAALRRMLAELPVSAAKQRREPLATLCAPGVDYGWRELERRIRPELLTRTSTRARTELRRHLQGTLEWITRACFELEWTSFALAMNALGLATPTRSAITEKFLGEDPSRHLFALFGKFPVLAALWSAAIEQWREHITELLTRASKDERAIARSFFSSNSTGRIVGLRLGLSDRHLGGRSVALVRFEHGEVIYKPRAGTGEATWNRILRRMNDNGFKPRLKELRVLRRSDYHWMEYVKSATCESAAASRRFYERLGGLIAAADLLQVVDCHRDNLIASGEHPVLVDVDALFHPWPSTQSVTASDRLFRTGFFPNSDPDSLQSRSSVFGKLFGATHLTTLNSAKAADYTKQITAGFIAGWRCLVGTPRRRAAFLRRLRRIRSQRRRCIYAATETYAAIVRASLQPPALTCPATRRILIKRLATRSSRNASILSAEIRAVEQLDIPYFNKRANAPMPAFSKLPQAEFARALTQTLKIRLTPPGVIGAEDVILRVPNLGI